jgi:hypothetical protein
MVPKSKLSVNTLLRKPAFAAGIVFTLGVVSFTIACALAGNVFGFMGSYQLAFNILASASTVVAATGVTYCAAYAATHRRENIVPAPAVLNHNIPNVN